MIDIGNRRELFTDRYLAEKLEGVDFKLHTPRLAPEAESPLRGSYPTVFRDGSLFKAYYRSIDPSYTGRRNDGNPGEVTCYAESRDGIEWNFPELNLVEMDGSRSNNAVLRVAPFCHNFAPFLDSNPAASAGARYKALAGSRGEVTARSATPFPDMPGGLYAFHSADGINWDLAQNRPVIQESVVDAQNRPVETLYMFDSQNVSFWSPEEQCYVCYLRIQKKSDDLRSIARTTSRDFINWAPPVDINPNMPRENLYTSQAHPYFRAPHLYAALPTRYFGSRGSATDIAFMTARAGADKFDRLFTEAFIRPGLDPERWLNRANYAACGIIPTGPEEMSVYHSAGHRYTLRTDGFISVHAGAVKGRMTTRPFVFNGGALSFNVSTSGGGSFRCEIQDEKGKPLAGYTMEECDLFYGDNLDKKAAWGGSVDVSPLSGRPVRLCVELEEADVYSFRFSP